MTPEQIQEFELSLISEDEELKEQYKKYLKEKLRLDTLQLQSRRKSVVESMNTPSKKTPTAPRVDPF